MRVAALQMNSQADVEENLAQAEPLIREAVLDGAQLIVLPEGFAFLGLEAERAKVAEELHAPGPILQKLSAWAKEWGVSLVAGGMPERSPDPERPFNSSVLISPEGEIMCSYRKLHLFDVSLDDGTRWHESRGSSPGDVPLVVDAAGLKMGFAICYDLRFPELFAWQRKQGAQLLTVPSAFTKTTGSAHWHLLLRARAVETQCFLVAAAQQGSHPGGRRTYGHALIVDPWGRIIKERTDPGPGVVVAEIDLDLLETVRRQIPLENHRRNIFS